MAVKVYKFLVKAKLWMDEGGEPREAETDGPAKAVGRQENLISECVEQVLEIIKQEKER